MRDIISPGLIEKRIYLVLGQKVMLERDRPDPVGLPFSL